MCVLQAGRKDTEALVDAITKSGKLHLFPGTIDDLYFIRFAICSAVMEEKHIHSAWEEISKLTDSLYSKANITP